MLDQSVLWKYVQMSAVENSDDIDNSAFSVSDANEHWIVVDCDNQYIENLHENCK